MTDTTLDPRISEFETAEQEAEHTAWIRGELERRQSDLRPPVPMTRLSGAWKPASSFGSNARGQPEHAACCLD